jgi:hypothetical protein
MRQTEPQLFEILRCLLVTPEGPDDVLAAGMATFFAVLEGETSALAAPGGAAARSPRSDPAAAAGDEVDQDGHFLARTGRVHSTR